MEKKYQVFLSSTYLDLKDERKQIFNCLLMADCIPAGMEAFPAADDEQFNYIKKVIDLCDYYILIIGNRYGSIQEKTQKSYTQLEYEYALSKQIPVLVFVKTVDSSIEFIDESKENQTKLQDFREAAMRERLASVWSTETDLIGKVSISIMKAKETIKRPGWVRNFGFDPENVTNELDALKNKMIALEKENEELRKGKELNDTAQIDWTPFTISLHFTETRMTLMGTTPPPREEYVSLTLEELFKFISVRLTGKVDNKEFRKAVSAYKKGFNVDTQQALIVRSQLITLGILETVCEDKNEYVTLTELGRREMSRLNAPSGNAKKL